MKAMKSHTSEQGIPIGKPKSERGTVLRISGFGLRISAPAAVLVCAVTLLAGSARSAAAERQNLRGSVPATVGHLRALGRLPGTNRLHLVIVLPLRNGEALDSQIEQIYDPASPAYHQYLTPGQFAERFGPTRQDYEAVRAFAQANGLQVKGLHPNRTLMDVSGAAADIERAFHVNLHVYQHPTEARKFYAPDVEPSLDLAVPLLLVSGLNDFGAPRPASRASLSFRKDPAPASAAQPSVAGSGPRGYLIGRDFRAAYAPGVSLDGAGQAVGLLQFDGYYSGDVLRYQTLAGLPSVTITNVLVGDFTGDPGPNNLEVALDIEMAIAMAPGLAKVIVYEADPSNGPLEVLNRMATDTNSLGQPAAWQLSSSWSWPGFPTAGQDQVFKQFAAQGQSYFQASGDYGSYCASCPPDPPIESTNITIVGGTILSTSQPGGAWVSETVWNVGPQPGGMTVASAGGFSMNYAIPPWQQGVDMTSNGGSPTLRNFPDVACVADGIWVVVNNGEQGVLGGTSAATPLWAGFAALVNQQAAASGKPSLGFVNPALYAIGKSSGYSAAFHDITLGNNTNGCCNPNTFFARPGYDLCTGWGTPTGSNLISALLAPPAALRITPAAPLTFSGPLGGPFRPAAYAYLLTNDSNAVLAWTLTHTASWLNVSPVNGTLTNGGPAVTVTATLTSAASSLPLGSYSTTIWFTNASATNLNDRPGQSRQVRLDIVAPPVIASQPTNQTVFQGATASFTVGVSNSASCSYRWRFDNGQSVTNLTDGGNVAGSATSTLVLSDVVPADDGAYSVIVSNAAGSVSSANAYLAVLPWRPVITSHPASQSVLQGQAVAFTVTAVGVEPLYYLWMRNGSDVTDGRNVSGAATSSLTIRSATAADAGTYSVVVGNAYGLATSSGAVLTVTSIAAPNTTLATAYAFTGGNDGANPNALVQAANGSFYGTAQNGGTNQAGTVFQLTAAGAVTGLYSFSGGDDGATPFAPLAKGYDGNYYGTTYEGGAYDNGTVFRMTPSGVLTSLLAFNVSNGDLPLAGLALDWNGAFYGTCYQGGASGRGTAFRITTNGALTTLHSFSNGQDGGHVAAGLLRGSDGNYYGTTYKGGAAGYGTVFRITTNGTLTTLAFFDNANGALPVAGLVQDAGGDFYGTTTSGGAYNHGAVFRMSPDGLLTNLYSFAGGTDGSYPAAALLQGSDGNFYGPTAYGGAYGDGTVFRMTPDGTLTTLVAFDGYAGANPQAALIEDEDGSLLGTTQNGGADDAGLVFRLSFAGPPQFTAQPAGQSVYVGDDVMLSVAVSGASPFFYQWEKNGTNVTDGGKLSGSTSRVLRLSGVTTNDAGTYSVLVSNPAGTNHSAAALLQVTSIAPLLLMVPTSQTFAPCATVSFSVAAVGDKPLSYLWQKNGVPLADSCDITGQASDTLVINHAYEGNNGTYTVSVSNARGSTNASASLTVVPVSAPCTSLTTRHWFTGGSDGQTPNGLAFGTNGVMYGTTYSGGGASWGTVFSMTTNGTYAVLATFMQTNGAHPTAAPVQGTDGKLYGTTAAGGAYGAGTVFAMTVDGTLSTLYSFAGQPAGAGPSGELLPGPDGNFYGTTTVGGVSNLGTVFRTTPSGALTNLHSFNGADGATPAGGVTLGCDGSFYGLTSLGGANGKGTVFKISPAGGFTLLYSFTGLIDGYEPVGRLVCGTDCSFYGVARHRRLNPVELYGTVFKITPSGALTTLHTFGDVVLRDGWYPYAGLMQSTDGNLYGTTYFDPVSYFGTVFRLAPDGNSFATLVYFDGCDDGASPAAPLVEDAAGNLYGTTTSGGPCVVGHGTLFELGVQCAPQVTGQPASQVVLGGANVMLSVAVSGARPFSYQWQKNGTNLVDGAKLSGATDRSLTLANVSLADAGTNYSVVVSNALGSVASAGARLTVVYPPAFLSTVKSNCTLTLSWSTIAGQPYRLQRKSGLLTTNWTYLGNLFTATGSVATASDNVCTNAQQCYRVVMFPQIR